MSRIGKLPIPVPAGVTVDINGQDVSVKGPKGELKLTISKPITATLEDGSVIVARPDEEAVSKSLHGLTRSLIANNVHGVSEGFTKNLEIVGTGYRAAAKGSGIELSLGFSHPVIVTPPEGVSLGELALVRKTPRTGQQSAQNSSEVAREVAWREVGQRTTAGFGL